MFSCKFFWFVEMILLDHHFEWWSISYPLISQWILLFWLEISMLHWISKRILENFAKWLEKQITQWIVARDDLVTMTMIDLSVLVYSSSSPPPPPLLVLVRCSLIVQPSAAASFLLVLVVSRKILTRFSWISNQNLLKFI